MDLERLEAEGVYDPGSSEAAQRLELLEFLDQAGATDDQLIEASALVGGLYGLAALLHGPPATVSLADLCERSGQPLSMVQEVWVALGLPLPDLTEPIVSEAAADKLLTVTQNPFLPLETGLVLLRSAGQSLARFADAAIQTYLDEVEMSFSRSDMSELQKAQLVVAGNQVLLQALDALSSLMWNHLSLAGIRNRRARTDPDNPSGTTMAIGFVDLVGFTSLSLEADPGDLRAMVQEFEAIAVGSASRHEGFVVKFIGDAVMFGAPTAMAAAIITISIIDELADPSLTLHGGLAMGQVIARGGDYFGPVVNLAARAATQAVPDEVLVSESFVTHLEDEGGSLPRGWMVTPAGRRMLKGFSEPTLLWSLSRQAGTDG